MTNHREILFSQMRQGAWIITPNNRLAQQLTEDFFASNAHLPLQKPVCIPYRTALQRFYQLSRHHLPQANHPVLLNQQHQQHLWSEILSSVTSSSGLLQEVQNAWRHCQQWGVDIHDPLFRQNSLTQLLQQWATSYQQELKHFASMTEEEIVPYLIAQQKIPLTANTKFVWVCFDDFTPQQRSLQQFLQDNEHQQIYEDIPERSAAVFKFQAKDEQEEQQQLLHWLKTHLAKGVQRIAVVVPDLQTQHQSLQRLFLRHFSPQDFNISLGKPLKEYALIAHALTWLELDPSSLTNQQLRLLLHSPFLSLSQTEFMERSHILHDSRLLQEAHISAIKLQTGLRSAPKLLKLINSLEDYPQIASPEEWVRLFKLRLSAVGFPGECPLSSTTYQVYHRFLSLFEEFLTYGLIKPTLSKSQAFDALISLTETTVFQARTPTSPIQILGLLEASGCTFDCIWICGMTDLTLPQKTRLSPFIPLKLQTELKMPHVHPEREFQFAQSLVRRLTYSGNEVVFSYASLVGDTPNLPSTLIIAFPEFPKSTITTVPFNPLQVQYESYLVPFSEQEKPTGGTALLADQAKCPFRAFAAHRLGAQESISQSIGLDARTRGQLVHKIMENLWLELQDQTTLLNQTAEALQAMVNRIINNVLSSYTEQNSSLPTLIYSLEIERAENLVNVLLEWEKQRPAFAVAGIEEMYEIDLAGIKLKLRVDRIDQVGEKKWVIDYKSSLPAQTPWEQERPEEPQLLLYALLDEKINALLFLELKNGRLTCKGLSAGDTSVKNIAPLANGQTWDAAVQQWKLQLQDLAQEFHQGECKPTPTRIAICQQCDFQNLCRIRA
jgi:ATP-dependent helicase/nuclease subunit B